jgi:hypothetical protein
VAGDRECRQIDRGNGPALLVGNKGIAVETGALTASARGQSSGRCKQETTSGNQGTGSILPWRGLSHTGQAALLVTLTEVQPLTSQTKTRLFMSMASFAALAILAGLTLEAWQFRAAVWVVLAGLATKTWIAAVRRDE